jgi:hypothetical protein
MATVAPGLTRAAARSGNDHRRPDGRPDHGGPHAFPLACGVPRAPLPRLLTQEWLFAQGELTGVAGRPER